MLRKKTKAGRDEVKCYIYSGTGNRFVLLPDFEERYAPAELPELARQLCRRWQTDGLMLLRRAKSGLDCKMLFYNNDGSTAEMCGNGARCLCRFCHDHGLSGQTQRIETPAGPVTGWRLSETQYRIALNRPTVFRLEGESAYLELGDPGIPHAVVPGDFSQSRDTLREFARSLRHSPSFPRGANVNLYALTGENELRLLTFERGVEDFTPACGTGTGASVAALTAMGLVTGKQTRVNCDGGALLVDITPAEPFPDIFLTGPAELLSIHEL